MKLPHGSDLTVEWSLADVEVARCAVALQQAFYEAKIKNDKREARSAQLV